MEIVVGVDRVTKSQPILLGLLNQEGTPIDIQMMSISCMSCVVMKADELFVPFAVFMRLFSEFQDQAIVLCRKVLHTRDEALLTLRSRALELVGKVIKHVGFDYLQDNVNPILEDVVIVCSDDLSFCLVDG